MRFVFLLGAPDGPAAEMPPPVGIIHDLAETDVDGFKAIATTGRRAAVLCVESPGAGA